MTTPQGSSAAPPTWTPPPPPPPRKPGLSKGALIGIAVVVVVIILVLALLLTGVIPGLKSNSSSGGGGGPGSGGSSYNVTFSESGLPSGTSWTVTVSSTPHTSTSSTIVVSLTNASYSWSASASGYTASPSSGTVTVSGAAQTVSITFTALPPGTYTVTFTESGLPASTSWSVTFNGTPGSSSTSSIQFSAKNGTIPFTVGTVTGYTAAPSSGNVHVAGQPVTQAITFTSSGGGGGGGGQTKFSQEYPVAASKAGSGWIGIFGAGVSVTSTWSNSSKPEYNATCPVNGASSTWPTLSPWTGAYANGYATYWVFFFYQNVSGSPTLLIILVTGSTATEVGTISGGSCVLSEFGTFNGIGSGIIDSDTLANDLQANDSAYVAANPSANADYTLISGGTFHYTFGNYSLNYTIYPSWDVHFTTCSVNGGGTGNNFTATVNATNGQVTYSNTTTGQPCGSSEFAPAHPGSPTSPVEVQLRRP
jgi:hypothetical protein